MDYALLAATALGAIGLYMLLPRERASMARLGGLLTAMAFAGLFLYLVRTVVVGAAGPGGETPPVYFYLFAAIMVAGAIGVVCQPRPVYAALYFVLVTLAGAGVFVLLLAEFMAVVLIIIYAGAILVTYVFVIMLASQGSTGGTAGTMAPEYDRRANEPFVAVAVAFVLIGAVLQVLFPTEGRIVAEPSRRADPLMVANIEDRHVSAVGGSATRPARSVLGTTATAPVAAPATAPVATTLNNPPENRIAGGGNTAATRPGPPPAPSNVQVLGASLYSKYALSLELAGILLTIALVGAVVIARKNSGQDVLGTGKLPTE
jgi:NADH-quinone oxidoreductase subunit J